MHAQYGVPEDLPRGRLMFVLRAPSVPRRRGELIARPRRFRGGRHGRLCGNTSVRRAAQLYIQVRKDVEPWLKDPAETGHPGIGISPSTTVMFFFFRIVFLSSVYPGAGGPMDCSLFLFSAGSCTSLHSGPRWRHANALSPPRLPLPLPSLNTPLRGRAEHTRGRSHSPPPSLNAFPHCSLNPRQEA